VDIDSSEGCVNGGLEIREQGREAREREREREYWRRVWYLGGRPEPEIASWCYNKMHQDITKLFRGVEAVVP